MKIERLSRKESAEAMSSWISSSYALPSIGKDYSEIRKDITGMFKETMSLYKDNIQYYRFDVCFGSLLYDYLNNMPWFTVRIASDDGFWRYLSLKVVPNIVGKRWDNNNADHYYTKPSRIWLKTLWWYFYLSLTSGNTKTTERMLLSGNFSTDTILNLVERTGKYGTNIKVYRSIMAYYSKLKDVSDSDFRKIMKLNTAKSVVIEPVLFEGGINGYVESLFKELDLI